MHTDSGTAAKHVVEAIEAQLQVLRRCFVNEYLAYQFDNIEPSELGETATLDERGLAARIEKIILIKVKKRLDEEPRFNHEFKDSTEWAVLNQLLAVARLKEVASVKIVKKGGRGPGLRYDISDLASTFFGKRILAGLQLQRRRVATKDELETIRTACQQIKLALPEVIEPTTTEEFFAPASHDEQDSKAAESS